MQFGSEALSAPFKFGANIVIRLLMRWESQVRTADQVIRLPRFQWLFGLAGSLPVEHFKKKVSLIGSNAHSSGKQSACH